MGEPLNLSGLTPTQRSILALLASGYSTKRIAAFLGIARSTVQVHVSSAMRRTHADTRTHLVAEYVRQEGQDR